jgi:hypothetical protein
MTKRIVLFLAGAVVAAAIARNVHSQAAARTPPTQAPAPGLSYAGSAACGDCHASIYERWAKNTNGREILDVLRQEKRPSVQHEDPLTAVGATEPQMFGNGRTERAAADNNVPPPIIMKSNGRRSLRGGRPAAARAAGSIVMSISSNVLQT